MIEREFVKEKIRNFKIKELVESKVSRYAGIGDIIIEKTPLGERVLVHAYKPGLVIGSGGETVKELTRELKEKFGLENPQIEVKEIKDPDSWASVVAKKIASDFERFGPKRYKAAGYRALTSVMRAGARGVEIRITGVGVPGARARSWRFFAGYLKKSGDTAETIVDRAFEVANLKRGTIGIKVAIMPAGTVLPDDVSIRIVEEEASVEEEKEVIAVAEHAKTEEKSTKKKVEKSVTKKMKGVPKKTTKSKTENQKAATKSSAKKPVKKKAVKANKASKSKKETKSVKIKSVIK